MIKGRKADMIVTIYLLATLWLRFSVEDRMEDHPILSILLGFIMLILLWAMIKLKWLEPNYYGLLSKKSKEK